jgi:Zn finger protein HypA/HybF involved in hydrogenase expression
MEKIILEELVKKNFSIRKIAKETKIPYTTIRYWLDKHGLKTHGYEKINNWEKEKILEAVKNSKCKSDVLRFMGISTKSGNFQTLDKHLKKFEINSDSLIYDNTRGNKWIKKYSNDDVFCEKSTLSRKNIKERIIKDKLIEYKCHGENCDIIDNWKGNPLSLQLDHINGINDDNRLENLRFLCPNCHSQTETFCVGNKK